jgi:hypothetical protein
LRQHSTALRLSESGAVAKAKLKLSVAHQVPGRIRMKIPSAKGDSALLQTISETFAVIPGVEKVTVNPLTGSVVLHYDVERHDDFHGGMRNHGVGAMPISQIDVLADNIEREAEYLARNSDSARVCVDFCKKLDREIKIATGNVVDLKIAFALAVIGVTIVEIGATAATPVWLTIAFFTANHFVEMQTHGPHAAPAAAPVIVKGG